MKFHIKNNTGNDIDYEDKIHSLCSFAQKRIGFQKPPSIFLDHDNKNASSTLARTGYYDPNTMEIHVYTTDRHPKDILRSISHELVHHGQHMRGELDIDGYSGKGYAQKNPKLRRAEMEANDPMLFRDWEDSLKEKENTIYNERRNRKMSIKDWKNNELSENLSRKWGFKMNLDNLKEGMGAHADDPMGGMQAQEMMPEPPMTNMEVAMEDCMQAKMSKGMSMDEAKFACMREMQNNAMAQAPAGERDPMMPFQEGKIPPQLEPFVKKKQDDAKDDKDKDEESDKEDKKDSKETAKSGQKPDFPDVDGDGDRTEPISKASKEAKNEAAIGGDKAYLEKLLAMYGADAKIGDVAKKEKESKKMEEASTMSGGNVEGHAGKRRDK
jgi:hypothetical protein